MEDLSNVKVLVVWSYLVSYFEVKYSDNNLLSKKQQRQIRSITLPLKSTHRFTRFVEVVFRVKKSLFW